jgi:hypothetical protein
MSIELILLYSQKDTMYSQYYLNKKKKSILEANFGTIGGSALAGYEHLSPLFSLWYLLEHFSTKDNRGILTRLFGQ